MFLEYGVNKDGELVYVDFVQRGPTDLVCPYCGGPLLAKKGDVITHHLAHAGQTCRQVARNLDRIGLPCYDNFNMHLPPKVLKALLGWSQVNQYNIRLLEKHGLLKYNSFARNGRGDWDLTHKGKIPRGELSLQLFCEFQEPLIRDHHVELERKVQTEQKWADSLKVKIEEARQSGNCFTEPYESAGYGFMMMDVANLNKTELAIHTLIADLKLYRAQLRRILQCSLYFIQVMDLNLYKIGVTTRPIEMRMDEIAFDLRPHFGHNVRNGLKLLGLWEHRGNVELYFKHCYQYANKPIGALTEYFQFHDVTPILRNLRRMKPKALDEWEQEILDGAPLPKSLQSILGERTNS